MANLEKRLVGPVTKPVEYATVEESWTSGGLGTQAILRWVHCEHHVEVLDNLLCEPLVKFLWRVQVQVLTLRSLLACSHERSIIVALEQTGNLGIGKQCVHSLQES